MAAEASRGAPRDREELNRIGNNLTKVKFRGRDNQVTREKLAIL
jgi:hypothetical protein